MSQYIEELELIAGKTGELGDRIARIEAEIGAQTKTIESAGAVLQAAIKGLDALGSHALAAQVEKLTQQVTRMETEIAELKNPHWTT